MRHEKPVQEVWLGREFKDHAKDLSIIVTEFLEAFTHLVIYKLRIFPAEKFQLSSFYGLLTQECTDPETSSYIHKASRSLRKWVLHQNLERYTVALVDNLATSIAEYQVRFYQPEIAMKRKVFEFPKEAVEVNKQFKEVLRDFMDQVQPVKTDKSVSLRIYCKLAAGTVLESKYGEHDWEEVWPTPSEIPPTLDSGPSVDTKLLQLHFQYRKVEAGDEFYEDPDEIDLSLDSYI
uniref:HORMA domain-containing protein n=1 Tax=Acrobeloides nanus TaxID=290746 RepID=A0A914C1X6_9BILA